MNAGDVQHQRIGFQLSEIEHRYGPGVHILSDPVALTLLARLCAKGVIQPEVSRLLDHLYRSLGQAVLAAEFPRRIVSTPTRMIEVTPHGVWSGEVGPVTVGRCMVYYGRLARDIEDGELR